MSTPALPPLPGDRARVLVSSFASAPVLVVGDVMLDQFLYGRVSRISPEAPVPVVVHDHNEYRLGGAANVAHNVIALGGRAVLAGVAGNERTSFKSNNPEPISVIQATTVSAEETRLRSKAMTDSAQNSKQSRSGSTISGSPVRLAHSCQGKSANKAVVKSAAGRWLQRRTRAKKASTVSKPSSAPASRRLSNSWPVER